MDLFADLVDPASQSIEMLSEWKMYARFVSLRKVLDGIEWKKEKKKTEPNKTPKTKAITTRIGEHILLFPYKIDE